jgi:hypothetical protein
MPRPKKGEKTPGSGIKKGQKHQGTLEKDAAREALRQQITARLEPITDAQLDHAAGVSYMVLRNTDGTYTRATNVEQVDAALAVGETAFKLFTQAPNPQAYNTLLAYAVDRPKEQPQQVELKGTVNVVEVLRSRFAKRKKAE